MKKCTVCLTDKEISKFSPYYGESRKEGKTRNVCRKCKNIKQISNIKNNPERVANTKKYMQAYYKLHNEVSKVKSYRTVDKKNNRESITLLEFKLLILNQPYCSYCKHDTLSELGLDRLDNKKGHAISNVVICCEKCNHLLTDIPYEAKLLLASGLEEIRKRDLLKDWIIKTKRIKNG